MPDNASEPDPANNQTPEVRDEKPLDALETNAERDRLSLEKLGLEVTNLRIKNRWESGPSRYLTAMTGFVSIVTALVSVAGFWLSQQKVFQDRDKERAERVATERRADEDAFRAAFTQLLEFTTSDPAKIPPLKAAVVLQELDFLANRIGPDKRKEVTDLLVEYFSSRTADMGNANCREFEYAVFDRWQPYPESLKSDVIKNRVIFIKYLEALDKIGQENPTFFPSLVYENDGFFVRGRKDKHSDEALAQLFDLIKGLQSHFSAIEGHPSDQRDLIRGFLEVTENTALAEGLFNYKIGEDPELKR